MTSSAWSSGERNVSSGSAALAAKWQIATVAAFSGRTEGVLFLDTDLAFLKNPFQKGALSLGKSDVTRADL